MTPGTPTAGRFATGGADNRVYKRDKRGRFSSGGAGMSGEEFDAATSSAATGVAAVDTAALTRIPNDTEKGALYDYGGETSYLTNAALRTNKGRASKLERDRDREVVKGLDSLMRDHHLPQDVVVYRFAATQHVFGAAAEGDMTGVRWRDHGYVSTSAEQRKVGGGMAEMTILAPRGTPGLSHSDLDPDEILLGRGLTYEVVRDSGGQSGEVRRLDVRVVT